MRICRTCGTKKRITSFAKNSRSREGRLTECKECNKIYRIKNSKQRAEVEKIRRRRLGVKPKKIFANNEERRVAHLKDVRKYQKKYPERHKIHQVNYHKRNPHVRTYNSTKRRLIEKNQTPQWADINKIKQVYKKARQLTDQTGIQYEVDHYYPLRGKTVCGLHIAENLRILTAKEHQHKLNLNPDDLLID